MLRGKACFSCKCDEALFGAFDKLLPKQMEVLQRNQGCKAIHVMELTRVPVTL